MKVTLIDYTQDAVNKLLYTKATRLTFGAETQAKIAALTDEEKQRELAYMATTVPSSWEFVSYTFEILGVTRAFTHQFVRTRTGSYAQQTMRMLNVGQFEYVVGPTIKDDPLRRGIYDDCMHRIQQAYDDLIKAGAAIEDARGVLPTNISTNIIAQFNLRTLSDMVKSRSGARTQNEYRLVVEAMIQEVLAVHPWAKAFLRSRRLENISMLEQFVQTQSSHHSKESELQLLKALDQLRKEN